MNRTVLCSASPRRAFTLVEVMFSVIILGVGLIMTAAIFPVAISQNQSTADESTGAAVGTSAVASLAQCFAKQNVPSTDGTIVPLTGPLRRAVYGNLISNIDARYAWVPLYRRDPNTSLAQVFVFIVRSRNRSAYQSGVDLPANPDDTTGQGATLDPSAVTITTHKNTGAPDTIEIEPDDLSHADQRIGPGCFVLVAGPAGGHIGQAYRIGNPQDGTANTWQLAPGWTLSSASDEVSGANAYIVGRGYADPSDPSKGFAGPAQDVSYYTGFVPVP